MPKVEKQEQDEEKTEQKTGEVCWNCKNQGQDNRLDEDGVCGVCSFEKDKLYNGNIEADKAAQRVEAARAAERA